LDTFQNQISATGKYNAGLRTGLPSDVSEVFGLANDTLKYDYRSGGRAEWLSRVHAINLAELTPAKVQEWKLSFLARAGSDTTALRTARISVNATLRRARSLFSPRKLRHLPLTLPRPLLFEGIEFEARQTMKYRSEIDVEKLIAQARQELEHRDPEAYKAFLLAVGLGEKSLALVTAALKRRHWIRVLEKFKQYVQQIR
jgi:hypothetical protein